MARIYWKMPANGTDNFNDAANWIGSVVPASTDDAIISTGTHQTITLSSAVSLLSLQMGGNDTLAVQDGAVLTVSTSARFGGGLTLGGTAAIVNNGVVTQSGTAPVTIGDGSASAATFTNTAAAIYNLSSSAGIGGASAAGSRFENAGRFAKTDATTSLVDAAMVDTGTINVAAGGTLELRGSRNTLSGTVSGAGVLAFGGSGRSTLNGATLSISGLALLDAATLTLASNETFGGTYSQNGGTLDLAGFALSCSGSASFGQASGSATPAAVDGPGTLVTRGSTAVAALTLGGGAVWTNSGTVTASGAVTLEGANLTNAAAGVFLLAGDVGLSAGSGGLSSIVNAGTLAKTAGGGISAVTVNVTDTGTLSVASGNLRFEGADNRFAGLYVGPGMIDYGAGTTATLGTIAMTAGACSTNFGTVNESGMVTMSDGSTINNIGGSTWNEVANTGLALASGSSNPLFTNGGTLAKRDLAGTATVGVSVADPGAVVVAGGVLAFSGPVNTFAGTFTGAGTASFAGTDTFNVGFRIGTGGWTVAGGSTAATLSVATIYGGTFILSGWATMTLASSLTLTGNTSLAWSRINGASTLRTVAAATVNGVALSGTVTWANSGTITATGALTLGDGSGQKATFGNGKGGVYNITGDGGLTLGGGTTSVFANAGLLERTSGGTIVQIGVRVVDTGTVTIATGGLEFDGAGTTFAGAITGTGTLAFGSSVGATLLAGTSLSVATVAINGSGRLNIGTGLSYGGTFLETAAGGVLGLGANTLTLTGTATATIASTVCGTGGTLAVKGGSVALDAGAALVMSTFALSDGATVVANTALNVQANLTESSSTLLLDQHTVTLAHGASFSGGRVDGAGGGTLAVKGPTSLTDGLILGGRATLALYATTAESGGLTLGDSGGTATLLNAAGASFTIGDDSVIGAPMGTGRIGNAGTMTKSGMSGTSMISAAVINTGTIAVASGTLELASGVLGTGRLTIGSGTMLELGGSVSTGSTVLFAGGGGGGALLLDRPQAFAGTISGLESGDTIDLADIDPSGVLLSYADTSSGGLRSGTLTIGSGGGRVNLHLLGAYSLTNFSPAAPDNGATQGTLITFHQ